jgi:hypothetical protein
MLRIPRALLLSLLAAPVAAQEKPDTADMARRIMENAQPGPEHQQLAAFVGRWDATFKGMGMDFTIPVENRMILGGRFLTSSAGGTVQGMPFEILNILGFDRGPGVYTAVGFDTFGTFYVTAAGKWIEAENRAVLAGSYEDAVTGHAHVYEFVWTVQSPDRYTWEIVFLESGKRQTVMEGDYRRK